jgi:oxygen-independent coproporphyrinogen-3 oxidase
MAGLYLHIPFCVRKCGYCDFYSEGGKSEAVPSFLNGLHKEISLAIDGPFANNETVETVFFGGGTPSLLEAESVSCLLDRIRRTFRLSDKPEITIEGNPGTLSLDKLRGYRQAGVNRISLGVQSFSEDDLRMLGRIHGTKEGLEAVHLSRKAGFDNLGLDLIFGIPGQTSDSLNRTLEMAVSFSPEHLSVYALTVHPGTPFAKRIGSGKIRMPDEDDIEDQYQRTSDFLKSFGYEHYEISNFSKYGRRCRHNEGYWTFKPYLGLGPSAHSYANGKRFWNVADLKQYVYILSRNRLPISGTETIGPARHRLEAVALGLRRREGISLEWISRHETRIIDLVRNDIASVENGMLKLTERGFLLADAVAADLA